MKKFLLILILLFSIIQPVNAWDFLGFNSDYRKLVKEEHAIKKLLNSQVKYANKNNFEKFIATYDEEYINADGFDLDVYSTLVKDLWSTYNGIQYAVEFSDIDVFGDNAIVDLIETSYAEIDVNENYKGELKSVANSRYYLIKKDNKWKVVSDEVLKESTSMLYGDALGLDVKLSAPQEIEAGVDYIAKLECNPPENSYAIASIASDKVEYPQQPTKEVFRLMPDDNILERILTSNNENLNEYVVASIALTKASITDMSFNLSMTGFGYVITRVNVLSKNDNKQLIEDNDVKTK